MAKYLQIQIPKGCEESWDTMTQQHNGKFCDSCQKTVIDFTRMTDDQLVQFFKKRKDNVCGRFTSEQLNTDIHIPAKRIPWLKYFFQISIPAFLFSLKANAQLNNSKELIEVNDSIKKLADGNKQSDGSRMVSGIVLADDASPVAGATVKIKGSKNAVAADNNGKFNIKMPQEYSFLEITAVGFTTLVIAVNNKNYVNAILSRRVSQMVGELVIVTTKKKKNKNVIPISTNSFTIFPNPITSFSKLNIKWINAVTADQTIQIYNQAGVLQQQDIIKINKSSTQQSIDLKQLLAGTYIITITDSKTHKSSSQQFVVSP